MGYNVERCKLIGICVPPLHGEVSAAYTNSVLAKLQPPWWYDHRFGCVGQSGYVPVVWWLRQTEDNFVQGLEVASANPNELWLLGNEPELNNVRSDEAARAVRKWERMLTEWAVEYAVPGVNITLHRIMCALDWLDGYIVHGGPIPRFWHVHVYGTVECFEQSLQLFENWMQTRNIVRPVIVSEFASTEQPFAIMEAVRRWLKSGRLYMAAWFSAYYEQWPEPSLLDTGGELTEIGELYTAERHEVFVPAAYAT